MAFRGPEALTDNLLIRSDDLESRFLQRLQEAVLRDEVLDYAVERLREELQRRHEALSCQLLALRKEKKRIESEIANLVESIAAGKGSASVMAVIADREEKIREITDRLTEPGPESFQEKLDDLRRFALQRLSYHRDSEVEIILVRLEFLPKINELFRSTRPSLTSSSFIHFMNSP